MAKWLNPKITNSKSNQSKTIILLREKIGHQIEFVLEGRWYVVDGQIVVIQLEVFALVTLKVFEESGD
jgi:hypothetical protein